MANIAATDVTVTMLNQRRVNGRNFFNVQLAFGDGALTYGAGGVPITIGKLGCPNVIESLHVYDKGTSGYEWSYDRTNKKLVAMRSAAATTATHTHNLFLKNADQTDAANNRVNAAANKLGANTGSDLTVTGVADTSGSGGIVAAAALSIAAGTLAEPSTVAIAAQVLKCEIVGW